MMFKAMTFNEMPGWRGTVGAVGLWGALSMALCGGMASVGRAHAEVRTQGLAMPQALQGVQAAGSACARSTEAGGPAAAGATLPAPDARCAVSVDALRKALAADKASSSAQGEVVWVDVRRPEQAEADPWPGALRLSPDALRTKAFLRGKHIVLLGEGRAQSQWLSHCRRLKADGFGRVQVLQGGVPQWRLHEAMSAVPPAPLPPPVMLDGPGLWAESLDEGNLVIGLAGDALAALLPSVLPFASQAESGSPQAVRSVIERRRKATSAPLSAVVLAVTPERAASVQLDALRQALWPVPVLLHSGSASALRAQLKQMEAGWHARDRGPKQPRCGQ